jgi:hypothetical protein
MAGMAVVIRGAGRALLVTVMAVGCVNAGDERAVERGREGSPAVEPEVQPRSVEATPAETVQHGAGGLEGAEAEVAGSGSAAEPSEPGAALDLAIGRWLLVKEEPADGEGGFLEQRWRRFEIRADGTFHGQNHVEVRDGRWWREGEALRFDDASIALERLDAERLVLVEDLTEMYRRGGPKRRLRNTYRRISESELGPMLGTRVILSAPVAGSYAGHYDYSMSKLPTMEISIERRIEGQANLTLAADGSAEACFGLKVRKSYDESKYSTRDGKHRRDDEERSVLLGVRGSWAVEEGRGTISADRFWRDACPTDEREADVMAPLELECQAIAANRRLPVRTLACLLVSGTSELHDIALNPADTERSGPYTLQSDPMGRIPTDQGRPWILFGAGDGLSIESRDGRREATPTLTFSASRAGAAKVVEPRYIARQP